MSGLFDFCYFLVGLFDELICFNGCMKVLFVGVWCLEGLGDLEFLVFNVVVEVS